MPLRRYVVDRGRSTLGALSACSPERIEGGTHYFSTHGCKLGLEVGSLSFPDFFLVGALA